MSGWFSGYMANFPELASPTELDLSMTSLGRTRAAHVNVNSLHLPAKFPANTPTSGPGRCSEFGILARELN